MRNLVLRKRSRDRDYVCTTYFVPEEAYVFTLEGCDEKIEAIFRNAKGDPVAVLTPGESVSITRRGKYLICLEGRNALGSLWVEWIVPGSTGTLPTPTGEDCCDELRQEITNIRDTINNLEDKDTITTVKAGENVTVTKNGNEYTISSQSQTIANPITLTAGENITINKNGDNYTISGQRGSETITLTAGDNITINKNGNNYTISGQAGSTANPITLTAGTDITITKNGDNYTINSTAASVSKTYVDNSIDSLKQYFENIINNLEDKDTITTIKAGENVTVTKNGNEYTISSTGGSSTPGGDATIRSINSNIIITER